jgi:hypothetical protein
MVRVSSAYEFRGLRMPGARLFLCRVGGSDGANGCGRSWRGNYRFPGAAVMRRM